MIVTIEGYVQVGFQHGLMLNFDSAKADLGAADRALTRRTRSHGGSLFLSRNRASGVCVSLPYMAHVMLHDVCPLLLPATETSVQSDSMALFEVHSS